MSKKKCNDCSSCPSTSPKLELVKAPEDLKNVEPRNFWNTCPRKLDLLPTKTCHLGKPKKLKKGKVVEEPECPWWINSEKDHYCFWRYVESASMKDGSMDALLQNEIADKF